MLNLVIILSFLAASYGDIIREEPTGRIVGGNEIPITLAPHHTGLYIRKPNSSAYLYTCGGAIIRPDVVITAAHCTLDAPDSSYGVLAGATSIEDDEVQFEDVKKVVIHEDFEEETLNYDIALLFLKANLTINNVNTRVLFLPAPDANVSTTLTSVFTGWGQKEEGGDLSVILKQLVMPIVDQNRCQEIYSEVTERMFCAGHLGVSGMGVCRGDLGGALVQQGVFLTGIASGVIGCGNPDYPTAFQKVSSMRLWIDQKLSQN